MSDLTEWVRNHYGLLKDFAGPVATTIAAITAIVVTQRFNKRQLEVSKAQRDIALDKLKFDLFELRYGIYLAAKELIEYVSTHHKLNEVDSNHVRSLYVKLDEARFFFDKETIGFMQEITQTAEKRFELMRQHDLADADNEEVWGKLVEGLTGCDIALREMYAEAPEVFETSLRFDQLVKSVGPERISWGPLKRWLRRRS
jgi:hypothetical protein